MQNYPALVEEAEKSVNTMSLYGRPSAELTQPCPSTITMYKDPEYMKLFQNHDFRVALSTGIDREEIIQSGLPWALVKHTASSKKNTSPYYPGDEYALQIYRI
jgi:ABC-type oligopeptide transport system substrate-binding subunit